MSEAVIPVLAVLPASGLIVSSAPILLADDEPVLFDKYVEMADGVLYSLELVAHSMRYGQRGESDVV